MSPALSTTAAAELDECSRSLLDRALISGDAATLRSLRIPSPLAIFAGDLPTLLRNASQHNHPLHSVVTSLLNSPFNSTDNLSTHTYIAAIAVLNSFLRVNFAGPKLPSPPTTAPSADLPRELSVDGEEPAAAVADAHLLLAAESVLVAHAEALAALGLPYARWWAARASMAHHLALPRPTPTLHARIFGNFVALLGVDSPAATTLLKSASAGQRTQSSVVEASSVFGGTERGIAGLEALANIELCMAQQQFYDTESAMKSLARARDLLGVAVDVRGRLGVRTKFQQTPLSQLVARVYAADVELPRASIKGVLFPFPRQSDGGMFSLPTNVPLDDADVLGYIKLVPGAGDDDEEFAASFGPELLDMTPLEQSLLLGLASVALSRNASHDLTDEEATPYVTRVLSSVESVHGSCSSLQTRALLLRTRFERNRGRYMERNMNQMEAISDFIDAKADVIEDDAADNPAILGACERLALLFASGMPPRWELKKELAISFGRLGLVKSAMEIFRELEFWDELVDCYRLIGDLGAAELLVREQLSLLEKVIADSSPDDAVGLRACTERVSRRPRLLCVLGDLTRNSALYEQAWQESNGRCGRAKRSLGRLAVERSQWAEAILHLRDALKLNTLMPDVWFTCGCACIEDEDMPMAAICFTHVVQETPDNGEAWNNLGRVLCEMDRKKESLSALLQAAKYKRESWRIWDNVLTVATTVRAADEIVMAMGRLLELRGKDAVSSAPLLVAVDEVIRNATGCPVSGESTEEARADASRTCKALLQLLARATTLVSSDSSIWAAYARLHDIVPGKESRRKSAECRQRQIRTIMAKSEWKSEPGAFHVMATASLAFANTAVDSEDDALVYAATLHVKSVMSQTKDSHGMSDNFNLLRDASVALAHR
jgi:tetratricopeptide (TPR) repeat protein